MSEQPRKGAIGKQMIRCWKVLIGNAKVGKIHMPAGFSESGL